MAITIQTCCRATRKVASFMGALATDLRFIGMPVKTFARDRKLRLTCTVHELGPQEYAKIVGWLRLRQLWHQRAFVRAFEKSSLRQLFIDGSELEMDRIEPKIEVCRTTADFAIHRYCRLSQSVPSGPRVGRRIAALIYDVGQCRRVLMGAVMLASPLYSVHARDEYFSWANRKATKDAGLRRIMDLALCMALPPYNYLLAGKLMAMLAMSKTLFFEFLHRYRNPLLAVTTTCANGLHCPIFNRIMIRSGGLYRRIGETTGYTTMIFSQPTARAARALIKARRLAGSADISAWNTIRLLKTALRHCRINPEPLLQVGNHKGVYVALLDSRCRDRLQRGRSLKIEEMITDEEATTFWKREILPRRLVHPEARQKLQNHRFLPLEIRSPVAR